MREIKFRGLSVENNEWVYGVPFFVETKCFIINNCQSVNLTDNDSVFNGVEVIPKTIGQFTGLYAIKKRQLYEGDVVKWGHLRNSSREITNRVAVIEIGPDIKFNAKNVSHVFEYGSFAYAETTDKDLELIGNIHQNPSLS